MSVEVIVIVVQAVFSAFLCAAVADAKGRDSAGWAFVGLVTGILGLIAVAGLPTLTAEKEIKRELGASQEKGSGTLECTCPHCHAELELDGIEKETGEFDCPECGDHVKLNE